MAGKYKFSEAEVAEIHAARRLNINKRAETRRKVLDCEQWGKQQRNRLSYRIPSISQR